MNQVKRRLSKYNWNFAGDDPPALNELEKRIIDTARRKDLITYSDLVNGITFSLPNANRGQPFQIAPDDWTDLNRAIIGDFLGYISARSYAQSGIFLSAIVVTRADGTPGQGFVEFMRELEILTKSGEAASIECWVNEVHKVHEFYA